MKRSSPERRRAGPHGEGIRRAQESGRRQAGRAARQIARSEPVRPSVPIGAGIRRAFVALVALFALGAVVYGAWQGYARSQAAAPVATPAARPAVSAAVPQTSGAIRVGIVSGHRGNDSGSVCADGLTEAEVNFDIAVRVATILRARGYTVDVLDEFDARLKGYQAKALLSIHADSCDYINELATGFKVARTLDSRVPAEEDRLVTCVRSRYGEATGLRFNANTITYDMTRYHAFYEIAPQTPSAIIETGFLNLDRAALTRRADTVAQGVVDGLLCYLTGEKP